MIESRLLVDYLKIPHRQLTPLLPAPKGNQSDHPTLVHHWYLGLLFCFKIED